MMQHNFDKIVAIVNAGQEEALIQKARTTGVLGCVAIPARGTVSNDMLDLLGLEDKQRCVVQMIARTGRTLQVMTTLSRHFQMGKAGHGIIFTLPLVRAKGINAMFHLRDEYRQKMGLAPLPLPTPPNDEQAEEESMQYEHELLHIIVKSGFADEAMEAAKAAGAQGGTIIHGRGIGIRENVKLFGVAIEPEKDILMVLVGQKEAGDVLTAITEKVGLDQPGQGIAFSVPVGRVMGIAHSLHNEGE